MLAMSSTENHSSMCSEQFGGRNLTLYVSGFVFLFFTTVHLTTNFSVEDYLLFAVCTMLFYFKSFRFVGSFVALYHSIVKLLAVKLNSSSDLLYFLQGAGQFSFFFFALW